MKLLGFGCALRLRLRAFASVQYLPHRTGKLMKVAASTIDRLHLQQLLVEFGKMAFQIRKALPQQRIIHLAGLSDAFSLAQFSMVQTIGTLS